MRKSLITFLALLLMMGCSNRIKPNQVSPTLVPTTLPKITPVATSVPIPTPTATPALRFTKECLPIDDRLVELSDLASGTMLISYFDSNRAPAGQHFFVLTEVHTGTTYQLLPEKTFPIFYDLEISPDKNSFAAIEQIRDNQNIIKSHIIWLFDTQANVLARVDVDMADLGRLYWLGNERLMLETEEYGVLLLVNPFTGEQEVIANDLPNSYPYDKSHLYLWWPVTYSPDLEWVTYMTGRTEYGNIYMQGPVVYDLAAKQIIWDKANVIGSRPAWSPDGEILAFTGGMDEYQLFIFNRSGSIKGVLDDSLPHRAFEFSWSPDGNYIAFWTENSLMVYDLEQDWVFDTCIPGNFTSNPIWFPDSQHLIVSPSSAQPLFIDWQKKTAHKIKHIENGWVIGWMNSNP